LKTAVAMIERRAIPNIGQTTTHVRVWSIFF
jgi:transcriptional regulator